jgi:hypothetical protein
MNRIEEIVGLEELFSKDDKKRKILVQFARQGFVVGF